VILLDRRGAVIDANGLAERVLKNGDGIQVRNGRFTFDAADIDARLGRLLAEASRSGTSHRAIAASVKRPGAAAYRVLISPVRITGNGRDVGFVVVLYAPHERREVSVEVLLELYGLTPAQADVARNLYAGLSVEQTAAELDLSLNTVRSHLKQIFSKCDVQSQAELMHTFAVGPHSF
jgi:DNA-binding CsgD family transcriptional regulator